MPFQSINARPAVAPSKESSPEPSNSKETTPTSQEEQKHDTRQDSVSSTSSSKNGDAAKAGSEKSAGALWNSVMSNQTQYTRQKSADTGKRSHHRAYQTLHTGSKIKHLKKKDGEPLWRIDIQYDFLAYIFHNDQKVFTNTYKNAKGFTFADIYIDAMARSSKTSRVLCEKLIGHREAALNMAMVCLLVNIGRMNTTLNFFLEMRAQLRTYHPIPSLQTYSDQSDYKQLQDAPRLKSILKGACEDRREPGTFGELAEIGRTNPINLVFLVSTFASKVQDRFFVSPYEFHDLIMNETLTSESRGRAFLWLMWAYLETDLSSEKLKQNPFGFGQNGGLSIPELVKMTPEEQAKENIDTPDEVAFGKAMKKERANYLNNTNYTSSQSAVAALANVKARPRTATRKIEETNGEFVDSFFETDTEKRAKAEKAAAPMRLRLILKGPNKGSVQPSKDLSSSAKAQNAQRISRCQKEMKKLVKRLDRKKRKARIHEGALRREWSRIRNLDPLYNSDRSEDEYSDDEHRKNDASENGSTKDDHLHKNGNGSIHNRYKPFSNDYGEEDNSLAQAFRRTIRRTKRWAPAAKPLVKVDSDIKAEVRKDLLEREKAEALVYERQFEEERIELEEKAKEKGIIIEYPDVGKDKKNDDEKKKVTRKRAKAPKPAKEPSAKKAKTKAAKAESTSAVATPAPPSSAAPTTAFVPPPAASPLAPTTVTPPAAATVQAAPAAVSAPMPSETSKSHSPSVMSLGNLLD
ncbi:hypothetical protein DV495_003867 [Geotrichum candidum]|nr:hypothetical protein DV452_000618 [Geotrichum candidum]KAF5124714.1 hypothetical protein DV495_003867 [Geotrichum candidum]KAI9212254.1 hypothetical protein DS838_002839 [Geotrichum bryndzae]